MSGIILDNNIFSADGSFSLEDLMDEKFYEFSNTVADNYRTDMYTGNDMFTTFIQPVLAIERFLVSNNAKKLEINTDSCRYDIICMALAAAERAGTEIEMSRGAFAVKDIKDWIKSVVYYFGSAAYLLLKAVGAKHTGEVNRDYETFSVVRINQEYNKFEFLRKDKSILFDYENILSTLSSNEEVKKLGTVYNKFGFGKKLGWLFKGMANGFSLMGEMKKFLKKHLNGYAAKASRSYYAKRAVHTAFYAEMIDNYFSKFAGKTCITGKVMDRYGIIETVSAKKYGIKIVNYPHGIEFGFRMPQGLIGDKFYTTSEYAAEYFNRMYETEKFIFSNEVMDSMLNRNFDKTDGRQVVFFSEAHEPEVNLEIIEKLCGVLGKQGIELVLKPHPRENLDFYESVKDKIRIEKNFELSITGNICIARRSTVLVEALYNGSEPYAILTNVSDYSIYKNYPSLQDSRIKAFDDAEKLAEHIAEQINGVVV